MDSSTVPVNDTMLPRRMLALGLMFRLASILVATTSFSVADSASTLKLLVSTPSVVLAVAADDDSEDVSSFFLYSR